MTLDVATSKQKPLLQQIAAVQPGNTLCQLNRVHFLKLCSTGLDVYRSLELVLDRVSVARPVVLTFLRHNHAQASAKILPFAGRGDVQKAQVTQFEKLQKDEAAWTETRHRKKQFVLQQMDPQREHYLYDHIGSALHTLHDEIMAGAQWQAYEFEKALWYYHALTQRLYAEHPMRNNEKTRQLIGSVQLCTRIAARRMQYGIRRFLRVNKATQKAIEQVQDMLIEELCQEAIVAYCLEVCRRSDARAEAEQIAKEEADKAIEDQSTREEKNEQPPEPPPENGDAPVDQPHVSEQLNLDLESSAESKEIALETTSGRQGGTAASELDHGKKELAFQPVTAKATPSPRLQTLDGVETALVPIQSARTHGSTMAATPTAQSKEELIAEDDTNIDDGDEDDERNWRSKLRLLKLRHKKLSPHKESRRRTPRRVKASSSIQVAETRLEPMLRGNRQRMDHIDDTEEESQDTVSFASLKETRSLPPASVLRELESEEVTWRRNGSFRTFHSFFNGIGQDTLDTFSLPSAVSAPKDRLAPRHRPMALTSSLPPPTSVVKPEFSTNRSGPLYAAPTELLPWSSVSSIKTHVTSTSPAKKLPYIRRKPR
ncbi:hypothetical protein Poli38472_001840 [Pythium oligandrum]|uniref:Uncharacterized protein n=1 Tax=Pythium oligandrum TaxID=41045 RepID=A0A8K1CUB9_PYTOL|nr:hypothetical protein Poli38472_001840 [Pythium oligandrum]|eukprot:TMW69684.1 hypothetical protein Poli38472_001840 [Pythium oligandrum]